MPFIRGRFHINPIAGQALEAARAAEEALAELEQDADGVLADSADSQSGAESGDDDGEFGGASQGAGAGPIHRVEIEAAEMVPAHSGRAQRGFVAHVHREAGGVPAGSDALQRAQQTAPLQVRTPGEYPSSAYAPRPETHVFADHRDLVSFLSDQFAKDCKK
ncbi:MAG TPA: hypothetical protein VIH56_01990 [Candidatus Acidoferrales bacterium]